jgi:hypothetical protein
MLSCTHDLDHHFGIGHPTLQIERGDHDCAFQPEHVV